MIYSPYRCESCGKRFFKLSHRFESALGWGVVALLVALVVFVAVYVMHMDMFDVANFKRPGVKPPLTAPASAPAPVAAKSSDTRTAAPAARAAAGDVSAQYELGMLYLLGEGGVAKNYTEAQKWLEMAAKSGDANARFQLGEMYKSGAGALQNFELAFQWFELAAGQNHAEAQYNVAMMHKNGMGVPVDMVKAYTWVNIAAAQGHLGSITLRDNLLGAMSPQQVAEGQRASRAWKPSDEKPKTAPAATKG